MTSTRPCTAIVDGYSTGRKRAYERHRDCLHRSLSAPVAHRFDAGHCCAAAMAAVERPVPRLNRGLDRRALGSPFAFGNLALDRGRCERARARLFFVFEQAGEIVGVEGLDRLKLLRSFHAHHGALRTGDMPACGGTVHLVHDDPSRIVADIRTFRQWERQGALYAIRVDDEVLQ